MLCPRCRAQARTAPNPFYGSGQAVHSELLLCAECGYSGYAENDVERPAPVSRPRVPLLRRLRIALLGH